MSDSKPIMLKINIADVTASQLIKICDHVRYANSAGWKPEWLGSEVGHVWEEDDAWTILQETTIVTLYPEELDTFDMISFLHFIGVTDDKIWRNG